MDGFARLIESSKIAHDGVKIFSWCFGVQFNFNNIADIPTRIFIFHQV